MSSLTHAPKGKHPSCVAAEEIHAQIFKCHRFENRVRREFVEGLLALHNQRLHPFLGFPSIEAYAKEAMEGKYSEQLKAGQLEWNVVNTDEPENEHFVEDFGLVSSSLVVVEVDDDRVVRHQVLQDAWTLVRDKPRFIEYVQRSVGEYLKS